MLVVPVSSITILSKPKAMPPCGGQPEDKADNKNPNFSFASLDEIPRILNISLCITGSCTLKEPPPNS